MRDLAGLRRKADEISYHAPEGMKRVPWIETLALSGPLGVSSFSKSDDSVKLEKAMHDAALESVKEGYRRLAALNVPASRPDDFLAEMLRDDGTMAKVKSRLTEEAAKIKAVETRKRVQAEKKFAKKGGNKVKKVIKKPQEDAAADYKPLPAKGEKRSAKHGAPAAKQGGDRQGGVARQGGARQGGDRQGKQGGSKFGGSKQGGSKFGGSKQGASKFGGSKQGASKFGGSKQGGGKFQDKSKFSGRQNKAPRKDLFKGSKKGKFQKRK